MKKPKYKQPLTDWELFILDTFDFVEIAASDVPKRKQESAVGAIVKNFRFLFDKKGDRIGSKRAADQQERAKP